MTTQGRSDERRLIRRGRNSRTTRPALIAGIADITGIAEVAISTIGHECLSRQLLRITSLHMSSDDFRTVQRQIQGSIREIKPTFPSRATPHLIANMPLIGARLFDEAASWRRRGPSMAVVGVRARPRPRGGDIGRRSPHFSRFYIALTGLYSDFIHSG
ncbi:hypothetical protein [Streptomyces melanosporofaciens]|uniref:hypothetical protein n=1 Tax=Streptomyces melanosporofaciens TaxID=67327 RepID=UPI00115FAF37|nr:hypothetical protein [Streptomyces melanosporofaciens]